ncbi:unnamed protein product [Chondrus crispus]|uniref:Secreted protein n=1 Tax=Chondrus crispus TaxID=2769 RepID=R7QLU3_CHOCR|nr:unnamed protein product [Chondrus crispus]CDF38441.1 unnamed protein product [Chondrus crispus]|eukprot:XP_005718334.1 unnamed protein product [Chondrus crispus]
MRPCVRVKRHASLSLSVSLSMSPAVAAGVPSIFRRYSSLIFIDIGLQRAGNAVATRTVLSSFGLAIQALCKPAETAASMRSATRSASRPFSMLGSVFPWRLPPLPIALMQIRVRTLPGKILTTRIRGSSSSRQVK